MLLFFASFRTKLYRAFHSKIPTIKRNTSDKAMFLLERAAKELRRTHIGFLDL